MSTTDSGQPHPDQPAIGGDHAPATSKGTHVAALTNVAGHGTSNKVRFGLLSGKVHVALDFDAPLPDEVQAGFEGH